MSTCRKCGQQIIFRYIDGVNTPLHLDGSCDDSLKNAAAHTRCPKCRKWVWFVRSNGGSFWVDELGPPWDKHPCFDGPSFQGNTPFFIGSGRLQYCDFCSLMVLAKDYLTHLKTCQQVKSGNAGEKPRLELRSLIVARQLAASKANPRDAAPKQNTGSKKAITRLAVSSDLKQCPHCPSKVRSDRYSKHLSHVHPKTVLLKQCPFCPSKVREDRYVGHIGRVHQNIAEPPILPPETTDGPSASNPIIDALERVEALAALGWTLPMGMTPREFDGLVMQGDLNTERVEHWFDDYYSRNDGFQFGSLTDRLLHSDHLLRWRPLMEQVIDAFTRNHFAVCVPSLLTMLEGSIALPWNVTRFHDLRTRTEFLQAKIDNARTEPVVQYQWRSLAALVQTVFSGADPSREFSVPKRNLILHGKSDPAKWDRGDCLRLFQAIDTIVSLGNELPSNRVENDAAN